MNGLLYLLQLNIYLLLFYCLYVILLRNETFFKINRLYLVGSALLAIAIPLLRAEWIKDLFVTEQIYHATQNASKALSSAVSSTNDSPLTLSVDQAVAASFTENMLNANQLFWVIYGCITALFLLNFLRKLYLLNSALNKKAKFQAFSFFHKVVVDEHLKGRETIIDHEMVHVKQWHSLDVIFFELFAAFNWFNPVAFLYKRAIKNIHEFIADEIAATSLGTKAEYAQLLVSNAFGTQTQKLANSFFNDSLLKRRLIMLNKNKSQKVAILKYGLSVPLFAIMVICSSATIEKSTIVRAVVSGIEKGFPAVVDAITDGAIAVEAIPEVSKQNVTPAELETPVTVGSSIETADSMALESIRIHFAKNMRYSPSDQQLRTVGASYLTFELDTAGIIIEPTVVQSMSDGSESDLLRVAKIKKAFGKGLAGKYILAVGYELSGSSVSENLGLIDNFDFSQYPKYQKMKGVTVRGYVISTPLEATSDRLRKYFADNIKYPTDAYKAGVDGMVSVAFELDEAGIIINPTIAGYQEKMLADYAMRVTQSAKNFEGAFPGKYIIQLSFLISNKPSNGKEYSIKLTDYKDYNKLAAIAIFGKVEAAKPDSIVTLVTSQNKSIINSNNSYSFRISEENGRIENYIKVTHLKAPVILVDGKVAGYKVTEDGFKLDIPIYPKQSKIKIYTGDEAVKNYNESVRAKGLIVITTY
jgi:beta-lactamase regulating signal transducer with metallopeptidase domain